MANEIVVFHPVGVVPVYHNTQPPEDLGDELAAANAQIDEQQIQIEALEVNGVLLQELNTKYADKIARSIIEADETAAELRK